MSSSFEKSVKGATKIKLAPPKSKYIEHILIATHSGEHGVAEVFRALQYRLRDSTWTVVFKALITVHLMMREGSQDVTLEFLSHHKNMLATSSFTDVQTQGRNIRHYAAYLTERARGYRHCKVDFVRGADHRFEKLTVEKGLLRETEAVQQQIQQLLKCDVMDNEPENEITITVFRMLVLDLLALFNVVNQAMISILGHFFEMSKSDAERAMDIYRTFTKQTDFVVGYLSTARTYEHQTRVEVPKLKHAPVHLGKQLEDYLADPDFDINRRQYLAEQEAKKFKKGGNAAKKPFPSPPAIASGSRNGASYFSDAKPATATKATGAETKAKGPAPDLIDFFDSIEQNQQPMATAPSQSAAAPAFAQQSGFQPQFQQPQQFQQNGFVQQQPTGFQDPNQMAQQQQFQNTGFMQQQPSPVPQLQANFTGAGFGGYTPQPQPFQSSLSPISQNQPAAFGQQPQQTGLSPFAGQQTTNPFRASMMMNMNTGQSPMMTGNTPSPIQQQNTNPFAKPGAAQTFPIQQQQSQFSQPSGTPSPLQAAPTGTNPFARPQTAGASAARPTTAGGLMPQQTGSTNPFRQSQFVNTNTGVPWQQQNQTPIGGGLDQVQTVEVFPRPAQQTPWGQ